VKWTVKNETQTACTKESRSPEYQMKNYFFTIVCSALLLIEGCIGIKKSVPVTDHQSRIGFNGYSVLPPEGDHWYLTEKSETAVILEKQISGLHMFYATAVASPLLINFDSPGEFVAWVKKKRDRDSDPTRFRLIEHVEKPDRLFGAYCSRYYWKSVDTQLPKTHGATFILEMNGYSCMHPAAPSLLIDIGYSEEYDPANHTPIDKKEGEEFLRTLRFDDLERADVKSW